MLPSGLRSISDWGAPKAILESLSVARASDSSGGICAGSGLGYGRVQFWDGFVILDRLKRR